MIAADDLILGKFLYDNYKQALSIIAEYEPQISAYCQANDLSESDFETWHKEELEYLRKVTTKVPLDPGAVEYVTALQNLESARVLYEQGSTVEFRVYTEADFATGSIASEAVRLERSREADRARLHAELLKALNMVEEIEVRLQIQRRWQPSESAYQDAIKFIDRKGFLAVLDELEGRIVQRLFELSKANLAGTGEFSARTLKYID